jgi:hypothetical protein
MLPSLLLHLGGGGGGLSGLCHNSSCSSASSFLVIRQDPTSRRRRKKKEEEEAEKDLFQQLVEDIQISSFLSPLRTVCMYIYTLCNRASFFGRTQQRVYRNDAGRWPPLGHSKNPPTLYLSIYSPSSPLSFLYRFFFLYIAGRVHIYMYVWYRVFIKWEDLIHFPGRWIYDTTLSMRDMIILNVLH